MNSTNPVAFTGSCTASFSFSSPGDVTITLQGGFLQTFGVPFQGGPYTGSFQLDDPLDITAISLYNANGSPLDVTQFQAPNGLRLTPTGITDGVPEPSTTVLFSLAAVCFLLGRGAIRRRTGTS